MKPRKMIHRRKSPTVFRDGAWVMVDEIRRVRLLAISGPWAMVKRTTFGMTPAFNLIPYVCYLKELISDDGTLEET